MLRRRLVACLAATLSAGAMLAFEPAPAAGQDEPTPPEAPADPDAPDAPADPDAPDAPANPGKPGKRERAPARPIDTDSPVARALDDLLVVPPNYSIDGTVELVYDFKDETQLDDWTQEGLDQADGTNARGRQGGRRARQVGRAPQALSLGAASNPGVFAHRLELEGEYEITFRLHTERTTTRSELIFFAGKGGASWGTQLVQRGTRGWSPVGRVAADQDAWNGGHLLTVTLAARGDELVTSINGARRDATTKLAGKLAGRAGLWLTDMHLVVDHVTIKGRIDPAKL